MELKPSKLMLFSLNMVKERFVAKQSKILNGAKTLMLPLILISGVLGLTQILKCQQDNCTVLEIGV